MHNFIHAHNHDEQALMDDNDNNNNERFDYDNPDHQGIPDDDNQSSGDGGMKEARDRIAHSMWEDYQAILQQWGLLYDSFNDTDM